VTALLAAEGIRKTFPGVVALGGVSFDVRGGEVHALCGENGAGKSTLIKILGGIHAAETYEGRLAVEGRAVAFAGPADAAAAGIAVIHQELPICPELSVAENVFLGDAPRRGPFVDADRMIAEARRLLARFGFAGDVTAPAGALGAGQRQLVAIAHALRKRARVLVLDEPTAALSEREVEALLDTVRALRGEGLGIVYISHRLPEVFALADRITVLRDGSTVASWAKAEVTPERVIHAMVGRDVGDLYPPGAANPGEVALEVRELAVAAPDARPGERAALAGISFEVRAGEVLGLGGLVGAGRTELLMHLGGAWGRRLRGEVKMAAAAGAPPTPVALTSPAEALRAHLALVSEDRRRFGILPEAGVAENVTLAALPRFAHRGVLDREALLRAAGTTVATFGVRTPHLEAPIATLSGGNQQKALLGRALLAEPRVLLLDEPTRGIDVGAKADVYAIIRRLCREGLAVIMASSDMPELLGLSDRVLVLRQGRIAARFAPGAATQTAVLAAALGHEEAA